MSDTAFLCVPPIVAHHLSARLSQDYHKYHQKIRDYLRIIPNRGRGGLLADFPAVFFIFSDLIFVMKQIQNHENKSQLSRAIY